MGKEIGDFAGGLAQGATGGFQQLMQQQMQQRQFQEQREFAREQQQSQNTFTTGRDAATQKNRIALFDRREEAAGKRTEAEQQFEREKVALEQGNLDDRHADILGLKGQEIDANKEIRLADIERKDKEAGLVAAHRKTMVDLKKGEINDAKIATAHERRAALDREYRAYLAKSGITLERQNELSRARNSANRAQISMQVLKARGPETLAKLTALGFNTKQIDAAFEGFERAGNLALAAGFMPEAKQGEMLSLSQNYVRGGQNIYENAKAQGMSELEATNAVIRWSSDHLNDLPRVIGQEKKMRGLEAEAEAGKAKLIGELEGDLGASSAERTARNEADPEKRRRAKRDETVKGLMRRKGEREKDAAEDQRVLIKFLRDRSTQGVPNIPVGGKF